MRLRCLGVVAVLCFASRVLGDGCYIPERAVRKIPEIPAQRAVLSWKDGVETLVISSALDSEAQKLGWLIPIPAVPRAIEKESPGALKTLNFCVQPKITHDFHLQIKAAIVATFLGNLLLGTWLFKRDRFRGLLFLVLFLLLLSSCLLSAVVTEGALRKAAGVQVEKTASVGSYDISILRPSKGDDLNAWLVENGFSSLPAAADATIADYISQGWVFAAIKLTRAESGANAPHPIKMVFPSPRAVYPMRLTALAGGSPEIEVFVIADDRASCDLLDEEFCDRFSKIEHNDSETYEPGCYYKGLVTHQEVGHPEIRSLMWDNCVLTEVSGTIPASEMTSDVQFDWQPFEVCQRHFYTAAGARGLALTLVVWLAGGCVFVSMPVCSGRIVQPRGLRWYFGVVLLPAIVLVALAAAVVFRSVPKLDASEVNVSRGLVQQWFPTGLRGRIESILEGQPEILQGTERQIADSLLKSYNEPLGDKTPTGNRLAGTPLAVEDSPGNFTVEKQPDKVVVRVYDAVGMVLLVERPIPAPTEKTPKEKAPTEKAPTEKSTKP